jgi:hypothetical protein
MEARMQTLTVSQVARQIGVSPRRISWMFYDRSLSDATCPVVNGRRRIPADYVPVIEAMLRSRGFLPQAEAAAT